MDKPSKPKEVQPSTTHKVTTGCGTMYITICGDGKRISDVIVKIGKSGGCAQAQVECIANVVSAAIREGVDPLLLADMMIGVRCSSPLFQFGDDVLSCGDAIGKFLKGYLGAHSESEAAADAEEEVEAQHE